MHDLPTFWDLINQVLKLEMSVVDALAVHPAGGRFAVAVVLLVGLSEAVGESVVLFINRVSPRRFLLSLFISAILFVFTYAFWTASIYLVAHYVFGATASVWLVARMVAFAYAPRLLGFLAFLPYFGGPISTVLQLWSLLAGLLGAMAVLELAPLQAMASVVLGGLLLLTLERTIGRPILALARWIRGRVAGVQLVTDPRRLRSLIDAGPDPGLAPARELDRGGSRRANR